MSKTQLPIWKEKFGVVHEVELSEGEKVYFKQPNRKEFKLIFSKSNAGPVAMVESFVKNCYLGGDVIQEDILNENNTSYIAQLVGSIDELLGLKKAQIKKC